MKKSVIFLLFLGMTFIGKAQENSVILQGGYAFSTIENTDIKATGFRINGVYEFSTYSGPFSHGVVFGYTRLTAEENSNLADYNYTINSFPIYYAPKYAFGSEKVKVFIKGVLGAQFSQLKREGTLELSDGDFGFYGGGGAGLNYFIKGNLFLNAEYEIAWMSNSFYKDGWINSISGGIGFKF